LIKHRPAAKETIDLKFRAVFSQRSATRLKRLSRPTPCSVGGFPIPREGLRVVLRHALAGLVHRAKIVLRASSPSRISYRGLHAQTEAVVACFRLRSPHGIWRGPGGGDKRSFADRPEAEGLV
jgi:hypothetical protein